MKLPQIIDNSAISLKDVFEIILPKYRTISIATGYWDIKGIQQVLDLLGDYESIRLLIGRELSIPRYHVSNPEPDFPTIDIFKDLELLEPTPELKKVVQQLKMLIDNNQLVIKVYKKQFLHAKCYIFGNYSSTEGVGIIGSSNFTFNGLTKNTELNDVEDNHQVVFYKPETKEQSPGHLYWFDKFWNEAEVWTGEFKAIIEQSPVGDLLFSPYETYIKTLHELYGEELINDYLYEKPKGARYDLQEFQQRNANSLIRKLKHYRTAMLSDSVGLGKTITAIEVIDKYLKNEDGRKRVEIICPKSLQNQWTSELMTQGIHNLTPIVLQNSGQLESRKEFDQFASVSLFVIDESHNLRKSSGARYEILLDWIRNNPMAHVLLLTATPINNELNDLTNQLLLGTRGRADAFTVIVEDKDGNSVPKNFVSAINDLQIKIKRAANLGENIDFTEVRNIVAPILKQVVVRRTRQGIEKEFGSLIIDGEEKKFPASIPNNHTYDFERSLVQEILKIKSSKLNLTEIYLKDPEEIVDSLDSLEHPIRQYRMLDSKIQISELIEESPIYFVFQMILMLGFVPYRWRIYQTKYYGKTKREIQDLGLKSDESRELQQQLGIYGIFRTIFLKRMESSIEAIIISLSRYEMKLEKFQQGILKHNQIISVKDIDTIQGYFDRTSEGEFIDEGDIDEEDRLIKDFVDENRYRRDLLLEDIEYEKEIISVLKEILRILSREDKKLTSLMQLLTKIKQEGKYKKVLVFSYFADTINYLERTLLEMSEGILTKENTGFLSTKNRSESEDLAKMFSPISKKAGESYKEIDYLFSTDILSEGQNLQDCGLLVNYDLHWNPVRMIQRNGRINRIGSIYEEIRIYNLKPEARIESYLRLVKRLENKIETIRHTIGTDQSVLGEDVCPTEFIDSTNDIYSEDVQKRIKALEASEESGDILFAEDTFIQDLKDFDKNDKHSDEYKKSIYEGIPKGKWALMPNYDVKFSEIMLLASLYKKDEKSGDRQKLGYQFLGFDRSGEYIKGIPQLEALKRLRTTADDNKRRLDLISVNKSEIAKAVSNPDDFVSEPSDEKISRSQSELLRIYYHYHYSYEEIEEVRKSFKTNNVIDAKKISQLTKAILKLERESKPTTSLLKEVLELALMTNRELDKIIAPDEITKELYYIGRNA